MRLKTVQTVHNTLIPGSYDDHGTVFTDGDSSQGNNKRLYMELDQELGFVLLRNTVNGAERLVPLSNIASLEPMKAPEKKGQKAA